MSISRGDKPIRRVKNPHAQKKIPDRLAAVTRLCLQDVRTIADVLARARLHLSKDRPALAAELLVQAENMLLAHAPKKE